MGDGIQAAKAGILEIADVFVVNKADRDGAEQTVRDLRYMLSLGAAGRRVERLAAADREDRRVARRGARRPDRRDRGPPKVVGEHGDRDRRRQIRAEAEIEAITLQQVRDRIGDVRGSGTLPELAKRVVAGELDPYSAADELVDTVVSG